MVRVGTAALDGTKLAGNAGNKANRTHEKIEAEVAEIFRQAAEADQREERLLGAVFMTVAVGGLAIQRRWNRR
jgi:hypothetical protein